MEKCNSNTEGLTVVDIVMLKNKISFLFWEDVSVNYNEYRNSLRIHEIDVCGDIYVNLYSKICESDIYNRLKVCDINKLVSNINKFILDEILLSSIILKTPAQEVPIELTAAMNYVSARVRKTSDTLEILSVDDMLEIKKNLLKKHDEINSLIIAKKVNEVSILLGIDVS